MKRELDKEKENGKRVQGIDTKSKGKNEIKKRYFWEIFLGRGSGESRKTSGYEFFLSSCPVR